MQKDDLQCLLIGQNIRIYADLVDILKKFESNVRFKQINTKKTAVTNALKKLSGASLVFISDEVPFSLEALSALVWQNASDAIVVILTRKTKTISLKTLFHNTQFSKLHLDKESQETLLSLQFLTQFAREKSEFRRCKSLLGVSEKRCQWLVDSSREAVAFISRGLHLYANTAYLNLFQIDSVQELRSISVKDVIMEDEHLLFDNFQKSQVKHPDMNHSLILSMKKKNGVIFRVNIYIIASVYKGRKCSQIWIRVLDESDQFEGAEFEGIGLNEKPITSQSQFFKGGLKKALKKEQDIHPFEVLYSNKPAANKPTSNKLSKIKRKERKHDQAALLKGIIKRKEATILAREFIKLKPNEQRNDRYNSHQLLSLKVSTAQKKGIDSLLSNLTKTPSQSIHLIFWDKVKLIRLLQMLVQRKRLDMNLFIRLSEASIADKSFIEWLSPGLQRLGKKAANLTFLLSSRVDEKQRKSTVLLIKELRVYNCNIAFDGFVVAQDTISLLKQVSPDYVRFSLPWTRQIQGNSARETGLSSVIRQLESKNIKVIAPCSFSIDMKKLFILSGASFCEEGTIKNG